MISFALSTLISLIAMFSYYILLVFTFRTRSIRQIWSDVSDFNKRNLHLTKNPLHQRYLYDKLHNTFTKFYYRYLVVLQKYGWTRSTTFSFESTPESEKELVGILYKKAFHIQSFYGNIVYNAHRLKSVQQTYQSFDKADS